VKRWAMRISYVGAGYSGWQRQREEKTIQGEVENALGLISGERIGVVAAGRTDRGVHAMGQVVSFDMPGEWKADSLRAAVDANLPSGIGVLSAAAVDAGFSARHDALWREYIYFVWKGRSCPPHLRPFVWWNRRQWDHELARRVCAMVAGEHDFRAFCRASEAPDDCLRTIYRARYHVRGQLVRVRIRGDSFLTNMIRIIMGSLDWIAGGRRDPSWFEGLLGGKDRSESGPTCPPDGLFLWSVGYGKTVHWVS